MHHLHHKQKEMSLSTGTEQKHTVETEDATL